MKICIQKSTGKFCGSCSSSTDTTLINQAMQDYGIAEHDLEVLEKTDEEYKTILDSLPKPVIPKSQLEILQETVDQLVLDSLGV